MPPSNFYGLPPSWNPGYEIPDYVMAEPPGRGTFTTAWLPRGTISGMVPEFQAVKTAQIILGRNDAGLGSLGDDTLGVASTRSSGRTGDPIAGYGTKAASWLMHSIRSVPSEHRTAALRAVLDALDPSLWGTIETRANALRGSGMNAKDALQAAMAQSMSEGMLKEMVGAGKRAMRGDRQPVKRTGQLALGVYPDAVPRAQTYALEALGFSLSDLNPVTAVKKAISTVTSTVSGGVSAAGSGIKSAAGAVGSFAKKAVSALGSLACQVVSSPAGQLAATAAGGPAGGAGAAAASGACAKSPIDPYSAPPPPPAPGMSTGTKVAIGAAVVGGLGLLYVATKRK
jgi:hypothetical protein